MNDNIKKMLQNTYTYVENGSTTQKQSLYLPTVAKNKILLVSIQFDYF